MVLKAAWIETGGRLGPVATARLLLESGDVDLPDLPADIRMLLKARRGADADAIGRYEPNSRDDRKDRRADETALEFADWLASDEYRNAYQQLSDDVADAKRAASFAYDRAVEKEAEARKALEEAQQRAIVLADGRRVYFGADGTLYGEDGNAIDDEAAIAEAETRRRPDSTSHEEYTESWQEWERSTQEVRELAEAMRRLEELEDRIKRGNLTPEELAEAQAETRVIIDGLPPEARADYQRLHDARRGEQVPAYRAADPAFEAGTVVNNDFKQAHAGPLPKVEPVQPDRVPDRAPVYKSVDFE